MSRAIPLAALSCAAALTARPARAQMMHVPESDWRQQDRHDAVLAASRPPRFFVELRFGTYQPSIDDEPGFASLAPADRPYARTFGDRCTSSGSASSSCTPGSTSPLFHFGLEFDAVPIRIPYVGAFGLGVGWGFSQASTAAYLSGTDTVSGQSTKLMIMPMHGSLVLRADELMRRTGVPLVPYGKAGFGMAYWRASSDTGTEFISSKMAHGDGWTPSLHFAVGGMVALNFIEPQAAARLDETTGVHHAYAFGEYYNDKLTLRSDVMRVGTSSWVVGLAVDF
jgi:hypothetical protein